MLRAVLAFLLLASPALAAPRDAIGVWRTGDGKAAVEIKPCDGSLCGHLIWFTETRTGPGAALDTNNPDAAQRGRRLCGLQMLGGFKPDGEGWSDGWVYDPKSGNTYGGTIEPRGPDTLSLRGYVGIPLFGRSEEWTRAPAGQERCR